MPKEGEYCRDFVWFGTSNFDRKASHHNSEYSGHFWNFQNFPVFKFLRLFSLRENVENFNARLMTYYMDRNAFHHISECFWFSNFFKDWKLYRFNSIKMSARWPSSTKLGCRVSGSSHDRVNFHIFNENTLGWRTPPRYHHLRKFTRTIYYDDLQTGKLHRVNHRL